MSKCHCLRAIAVGLLSVFAVEAEAQFGTLSLRIPNDANTIFVLNADKILGSPLAIEDNWREQRERAAAAGVSILPASADQFLMAAKMDLEFMKTIWEVALIKVRYKPNIPQMAAQWGGTIDRVEGRSAMITPDDAYVVQLSDSTIGAMKPGNRQQVARWLRQTSSTQGHNISPYLKEALGYAEKVGTPIVMAVDMRDVISPDDVREKVKTLAALKGVDIDVEQYAKAISSIQGVTLAITISDKIIGAIKVDFGEDVTFVKDFAKPILLEVLGRHGAMIDEFNDWQPRDAGPNQIRIQGELFRSGLQRVLSIMEAPDSVHKQAPASPGEAEETLARLSSQQYFKSVTGLVEDLKEKPGKKTMGQVGIWFGRYAEKIDKLPMLNVDAKLVDYGMYVSDAFRAAEGTLRSVGGRSRTRQLNAPAQYRSVGRWGSDGFFGARYYGGFVESPRLEAQNRARIRTEERVQGADGAREIMQQVAGATIDIRREMTQKFQAEF